MGTPPADPTLLLRRLIADSATMQGKRPVQEDRHVKIPDLTKASKALKMSIEHLDQPCAFFAVYDGHRGHVCSEFAAKTFHMKLLKRLSVDSNNAAWNEARIRGVLHDVCIEIDEEFMSRYRTAMDGSTAVVSLVVGTLLFTCWLGDSRALLCKQLSGDAIVTLPLTEDHRPHIQTEAARVKKDGGCVVNLDGSWRVAHVDFEERVNEIRMAEQKGLGLIAKEPVALAVARSFGDRDFKPLTGSKEVVTAVPEVTCIRLDRSSKFIALVCDGISDVLPNEEIVFELDYLRDPDPAVDTKAACATLVQKAYKRGSGDNMTVVLVRFQWENIRASSALQARPKANALAANRRAASQTPGAASESAAAALKRKKSEDTNTALKTRKTALAPSLRGVVSEKDQDGKEIHKL